MIVFAHKKVRLVCGSMLQHKFGFFKIVFFIFFPHDLEFSPLPFQSPSTIAYLGIVLSYDSVHA